MEKVRMKEIRIWYKDHFTGEYHLIPPEDQFTKDSYFTTFQAANECLKKHGFNPDPNTGTNYVYFEIHWDNGMKQHSRFDIIQNPENQELLVGNIIKNYTLRSYRRKQTVFGDQKDPEKTDKEFSNYVFDD